MNGPDHYLEAERLLALSKDMDRRDRQSLREEAQVHATLALAAAVAVERNVGPQERWGGQTISPVGPEWREVLA